MVRASCSRSSRGQPPQVEPSGAEGLLAPVTARLAGKTEHEPLLHLEDAVECGCRRVGGSDRHAGRPEANEQRAGDALTTISVELLDVLEESVELVQAPAAVIVPLRVVGHGGTVTGVFAIRPTVGTSVRLACAEAPQR